MKWIKSFLLHPWFNRFNLLYLFGGFAAMGLAQPAEYFVWSWLGGEAAYLLIRGWLDRSETPLFLLRRLPYKERNQHLQLWENARRVRHDFAANQHQVAALAGHQGQLKRMMNSHLELLLLRSRLDGYFRSLRINYDEEIARTKARLSIAPEAEKGLLEQNLQVLLKRRSTFADLIERRRALDTRLETIENAVGLLREIGYGLTNPAEVADQVEVLMSNVADAETFANELHRVVAPMRVRV